MVLTNDNVDSRRVIEQCYKRHKTTLNPIIEWTEKEVWDFIKSNGIPYCSLYDEGFERIGCIGCPMAGRTEREREFARWSKYKNSYLNAFQKMLKKRDEKGLITEWQDSRDVFNWWMEYDVLPGQYNWFEDYEDDE